MERTTSLGPHTMGRLKQLFYVLPFERINFAKIGLWEHKHSNSSRFQPYLAGVTALSLSLYLKYKDMTLEIIEALKETKQISEYQ